MSIAWSTRQLREGVVLPPLPPLGMAHETSASSNSRLSAPLKRARLTADYTSLWATLPNAQRLKPV
jgi:hypothetical protein